MRRIVSRWEKFAELHTHDGNDRYLSGEDTVDEFCQTLATGNFSERNMTNCASFMATDILGRTCDEDPAWHGFFS